MSQQDINVFSTAAAVYSKAAYLVDSQIEKMFEQLRAMNIEEELRDMDLWRYDPEVCKEAMEEALIDIRNKYTKIQAELYYHADELAKEVQYQSNRMDTHEPHTGRNPGEYS